MAHSFSPFTGGGEGGFGAMNYPLKLDLDVTLLIVPIAVGA